MRTINSLRELNLPARHELCLEQMLEYLVSFPKIERVILFGSCARGEATPKSDIDLFLLGANLTDEDDWEIAWRCPKIEGKDYISCDLISSTYDDFDRMSKVPGMIQYAVALRGVDISELLRAG
jgi:predicted nucleotidyltransferase